jgi:hypothetical protein
MEAGPAGWLRESGSRLPHSKVTAAVTEGGLVGRGPTGTSAFPGVWGEACWERLEWSRASGLAPGKRQQASAVQGYGSRN